MRLGHRFRTACAAAAFAGTLLLTAPASAQHEDHGGSPPPPPPPVDGPASWDRPAPNHAPGVDPRARADWIDECSRRLADRDTSAYYGWKRERRQAEDRAHAECARYLDDYYAYYARSAPGGYGPMGYGPGCCQAQAMMMVPAPRRAEPRCTETVEEIVEYVPAPARRIIRQRIRVVPDKRIRITPDKRIPD